MRKTAILDTSVVVSGATSGRVTHASPPYAADLLKRWRRGEFRGVVSQVLLAEYDEVLQRRTSRVDDRDRFEVMRLAREPSVTEQFEIPAPPYERISRDLHGYLVYEHTVSAAAAEGQAPSFEG